MPMTTPDLTQSTYERWQKEEGIPIYRGYSVPNLRTIELKPWTRTGGGACFINLSEQEEDDSRVMEIPPGGKLKPERHIYEEMTYVISGRGATTFWQPGKRKHTVEWNRGSVFAPPLNCWHQHFNADGRNPARLLAVTTAPSIINVFHNDDFVFNNDFVFSDRYAAQDDYFSNQGISLGGRTWRTNFVPDVRSFELVPYPERGADGANIRFSIAGSVLCAHISQFPVGTYKKGHRHGPGAHVIILGGRGYSLLWPEGEPRTRIDWEEGSMFVPPDRWYHQHFNAGSTPARYLALRWNNPEFKISGGRSRKYDETRGDQIDYKDEDPEIRALFESELAKMGVPVKLPPARK